MGVADRAKGSEKFWLFLFLSLGAVTGAPANFMGCDVLVARRLAGRKQVARDGGEKERQWCHGCVYGIE